MDLTRHLGTNIREWPNSYFMMLSYTRIGKGVMVRLKAHILLQQLIIKVRSLFSHH